MVAISTSTDQQSKNNDNVPVSVSVTVTPMNSPPSRSTIPSSITTIPSSLLTSSISSLCGDDRRFTGSLSSLVASSVQTIPLLPPVQATVTPSTKRAKVASPTNEEEHRKHAHFIDDTSSATEPDYGYGDCGCDNHGCPTAAPRKRRRFERRNSKTSAMLLHAMSVVAATDTDQDDDDDATPFGPSSSSSLPRLPMHSSLRRMKVTKNSASAASGAVADEQFDRLYQSGIDIAETILSKMRIRHDQKHHRTAINHHPMRKFGQLK